MPIGNANDGFFWHTDQYYFERPTAYTFLYGIETPPIGADTLFGSTRKLYEEMSAAAKRKLSKIGNHRESFEAQRGSPKP